MEGLNKLHEKYTKTLTNGVTGTVIESEDEFTIDLFEDYGVKQVGYFEVTPYLCSLAIRFNDDECEHLATDSWYSDEPFIIDNIAIQKIHMRPLRYDELAKIYEVRNIRFSGVGSDPDKSPRVFWCAKYK